MRGLTVTVVVLVLLVGGVAQAEVVFTVTGSPLWQDSGISIAAGDYLRVTASGAIYFNKGDSQAYTNPDGVGPETVGVLLTSSGPPDGFLGPPTTVWCLVGKIGGTTARDTSGTPLPEGVLGKGPGFVGTDYYKSVPVSGRLYFAFNDHTLFSDNGGSYTLHISVPEPSTLILLGIGAISLLAYGWRRRKRMA